MPVSRTATRLIASGFQPGFSPAFCWRRRLDSARTGKEKHFFNHIKQHSEKSTFDSYLNQPRSVGIYHFLIDLELLNEIKSKI